MSLKKCGACKIVMYCNAECQKAHRPQHKKECRLRAAELHDEALFKQPPKNEDCPVCFLCLPSHRTGRSYQACCGKFICIGCIHAVSKMDGVVKCPFCRIPMHTSKEELIARRDKRVEASDTDAMFNLGCCYASGDDGVPKDQKKAVELWLQAANLGNTESYYNIGCAYLHGYGVERDEKKATHFWELAAIGGDEKARYNLGVKDYGEGNMNRALKHFIIAVGFGDNKSLKTIKEMYKDGYATKDDYTNALRAYQTYLSEIKSDQRDEAAEYSDDYIYHE